MTNIRLSISYENPALSGFNFSRKTPFCIHVALVPAERTYAKGDRTSEKFRKLEISVFPQFRIRLLLRLRLKYFPKISTALLERRPANIQNRSASNIEA